MLSFYHLLLVYRPLSNIFYCCLHDLHFLSEISFFSSFFMNTDSNGMWRKQHSITIFLQSTNSMFLQSKLGGGYDKKGFGWFQVSTTASFTRRREPSVLFRTVLGCPARYCSKWIAPIYVSAETSKGVTPPLSCCTNLGVKCSFVGILFLFASSFILFHLFYVNIP